ncbi:anthranilate synthase component 1 [[Haemophilus] felis]|nr:anthranilate synthase component 1 [[Haemophilus] felis]
MQSPFVQTKIYPAKYNDNPTTLFHHLCAERADTLLLESAEISSKSDVKSLLFLKTALKITCEAQSVRFAAQTQNGRAILPFVARQLAAVATLELHSENELLVRFSPVSNHLDEDSKLLQPSVFDGLRVIERLYGEQENAVMLGGLFGYDLVCQFMPMAEIQLNADATSCPDYSFYLPEQLLILDHQKQQSHLHTFCFEPTLLAALQQDSAAILQQMQAVSSLPLASATATTLSTNIEDAAFKRMVSDLKQHIYQGDVFQIVPSRQFCLPCPTPLLAYHQLKKNNPSPYMFFMQDSEFTLFGASPESALKYGTASRQLEIYPIAGSRPRGFDEQGNIDPDLDSRLELDLRLDKKELAEHLMLVDLARNDVARVCEAGSRRVADLMQVDRYSHIMHLVSRVVGTLRQEFDALHAYQACMNMGTLTGAPKIRAMQLIYQVEKQKRHSYGGAVGYFTSKGDLDTCIVIRSAFVQQGLAHIQAGCGVVLDSDPQMEADETRHKARAVIQAITQVNQSQCS